MLRWLALKKARPGQRENSRRGRTVRESEWVVCYEDWGRCK